MEKFWQFLQDMTFWNWISLIAFIFFPLSALNAFFSLRSRYLDWRGTKSKKEFERRVKQLEEKFSRVQTFEEDRPKFFTYVLNNIIIVIGFGLLGLFFFITGFFLYISPLPSEAFLNGMLFAMSVTPVSFAFIFVIKLGQLVKMVYNPQILENEIVRFVHNAAEKGFMIEPGSKLLAVLGRNEMPTD